MPLGRICCALYSRGDGRFHWTIVIPVDPINAVEMHAINTRGRGWAYQKRNRSLHKSATLCVLAVIGMHIINTISPFCYPLTLQLLSGIITEMNTIDKISGLLEQIPMTIPSIDMGLEFNFTCRVWFKQAVRVRSAHGVIRCPSVTTLEEELVEMGGMNDESVSGGGIFTIHVSQCSV